MKYFSAFLTFQIHFIIKEDIANEQKILNVQINQT